MWYLVVASFLLWVPFVVGFVANLMLLGERTIVGLLASILTFDKFFECLPGLMF